jgi:voltage-gated potassium channel
MFVGIAILGILITTLGAALLESRLKKSPLAFSDQTKLVIKEKINELEALDEKDFEFLISPMRSICDIKSKIRMS